MTAPETDSPTIRDAVREKYGQIALHVAAGESPSCCTPSGSSGCCGSTDRRLGSDHLEPLRRRCRRPASRPRRSSRRSAAETRRRSRSSTRARRFSTSAPAAASTCLLSAKRVGPTGKVYGLDMTDEMLALANENKRRAGARQRRVPQGRDREHSAARRRRSTSSSRTASSICPPTKRRSYAKRFAYSSPAGGSRYRT